jgi:hypothetical protein
MFLPSSKISRHAAAAGGWMRLKTRRRGRSANIVPPSCAVLLISSGPNDRANSSACVTKEMSRWFQRHQPLSFCLLYRLTRCVMLANREPKRRNVNSPQAVPVGTAKVAGKREEERKSSTAPRGRSCNDLPANRQPGRKLRYPNHGEPVPGADSGEAAEFSGWRQLAFGASFSVACPLVQVILGVQRADSLGWTREVPYLLRRPPESSAMGSGEVHGLPRSPRALVAKRETLQ